MKPIKTVQGDLWDGIKEVWFVFFLNNVSSF